MWCRIPRIVGHPIKELYIHITILHREAVHAISAREVQARTHLNNAAIAKYSKLVHFI
jgi:hypothetical protein